MARVFRPSPALPVGAVTTFRIRAPQATHWRDATCAEIDCARWRGGFLVRVDEGDDLGQVQAHYIRHDRSRRHHEQRLPHGLTEFRFEPGTSCFEAHRVRVDRQEIYTVYPGDWRGKTGDVRRHTRPADWVDQFAEHQDRIKTRIERG